MFELLNVMTGVVCGWVSDYLQGRRACVIAIFMGLLCPLLLLFALAMDKINVYLLLVRFLTFECSNLLMYYSQQMQQLFNNQLSTEI